jgi:hypothetical protein
MASEYLGRIEDVELTTESTEAQGGDLSVRPSEPNVYAVEIDVSSVRTSVRKGQGSVRELDCKAKAGRMPALPGSGKSAPPSGIDPRSKITIKSRKEARGPRETQGQEGGKKPSHRHNPRKH